MNDRVKALYWLVLPHTPVTFVDAGVFDIWMRYDGWRIGVDALVEKIVEEIYSVG